MQLVDVQVLDHLIVAGTTVLSMAERGLVSHSGAWGHVRRVVQFYFGADIRNADLLLVREMERFAGERRFRHIINQVQAYEIFDVLVTVSCSPAHLLTNGTHYSRSKQD